MGIEVGRGVVGEVRVLKGELRVGFVNVGDRFRAKIKDLDKFMSDYRLDVMGVAFDK